MPDAPGPFPVVVLAGGLGTRMETHAPGLPKVLVPILGEPFAFHQLRLLVSQGVQEVVYVVGHRGDEISAVVGDGRTFGLDVSYVDEGDELHGTAGALRVALDQGALAHAVAVLYGDSYLPVDLAHIWDAWAATELPALMTVFRNDDRWDRSNTVFEDGLVTSYDKRPEARRPQMRWIDYGLSILRREIVESIPPGSVVDLADVFRDLSARRELAGFEVTGRFYEVGSPEGLADLEGHLAGR